MATIDINVNAYTHEHDSMVHHNIFYVSIVYTLYYIVL